MTFSIVARSVDARLFGIAIASSSPAVAGRCAHALAGAGAVASQNITDPRLGPDMLAALRAGADAPTALAAALARTPHGAYRQLLVIGADGPPAVHTGTHALGLAGAAPWRPRPAICWRMPRSRGPWSTALRRRPGPSGRACSPA
jgi:uncharacterized Ntn-hydrolase superfamily protein